FRDKVITEALVQKTLRAEGKAIPSGQKKYARLAGGLAWIICGAGAFVIVLIGMLSGSYYVFFILLFGVLSVGGFIQLITGRHLISKR
ncbi:MAG: hypothetical protein COW24_00920, partial [Candidatus Kerfeldbacteria bacterium CG15_BIG_FIL_POST_REV_8_21_14_020_45_12]